jgi:hypothetical protein
MNIFYKNSAVVFLLLCIPLLFFPKVNILQLSQGETAGLRLDDFILLSLSIVLFWAHFSLRKSFLPIEMWLFTLVGFSLFSFLCNQLFVSLGFITAQAKVLYCFRILEYFIFFYVGTLACQFLNLTRLVTCFLLWNIALMCLQKAGIIGEFNSGAGYTAEGSYRVSGIASFPSEMGALLNLLFCYFLFAPENRASFSSLPIFLKAILDHTRIYWLFFIFAILIILTGSRIAIVALIIPFLFRLRREFSLTAPLSIAIGFCFIVCASVGLFWFITQTESIAVRSRGLLSFKNLELVGAVWDVQDVSGTPISEVAYGRYDLSWWMRIHKWCYALKMYCYHPECYVQGVGPGFAWSALDGGLLRVFVENGLLGTCIFWKFFSTIYKKNAQLKWMLIAFLINMIFFDVYLAYKPMSLLFFITGYFYISQEYPAVRPRCSVY